MLPDVDPLRFGRAYRALRQRRRLRQEDVAARAGLSKSTIGRIEHGQIEAMSISTLQAAAAALDAQVDVGLRWNGEALDRLLDEAHAGLVDAVVRLYRSAGWEVAVEVSFSKWGERGSIDVLAWHRQTHMSR